ncbi:MAG: tetratricopeptide repeat protein, partial [Lentisphaerae bacterium]|nr:tetratricopeptide repeat protein [Lentisphaerota bacterium]
MLCLLDSPATHPYLRSRRRQPISYKQLEACGGTMGGGSRNRATAAYRVLALALMLSFATWIAFLPMLRNGFIWDDVRGLVQNKSWCGLSWTHIRWMFTTHFTGPYQPLTWLSHALVHSATGLAPRPFLIVNLALHTANTVLLFVVFRIYLGRVQSLADDVRPWLFDLACAGGALFFGLHPLRVESVSWITERRDVLSGFFFLITLLLYARATALAGAGRHRWAWFASCLCAFTLSLLSKAWAMTLPAVLLVLDVFPFKRLPIRWPVGRECVPLLLEKLPFAVLAGGAAVLALIGQQDQAMGMVTDHGPIDRIIQCGYGSLFYMWKTVWPFELSPLYLLRDDFNPWRFRYAGTAAVSAVLTVWLAFRTPRYPWAAAAWFSYLITVAPVLGIAQSGQQIAADRYTYLATLPFAMLAAAAWLRLVKAAPRWLPAFVTVACVVLAGLGRLTSQQTRFWRSAETLWQRAVAVDPHNYVALNNLGVARSQKGDVRGALVALDAASLENAHYASARFNRGRVHQRLGHAAAAIADYDAALQLKPTMARALLNRGNLLKVQGKPQKAMADYDECVKLRPAWAVAYFNRGNHHLLCKHLEAAVADYSEAIRLNPACPDYWYNRATVRQQRRDNDGTIADL